MTLLNNDYFDNNCLIASVKKKDHIDGIKKTIRDIYGFHAVSDLESDPRFHDYPHLRKTLLYCMQSESIEALKNNIDEYCGEDWVATGAKEKFQQLNAQYNYFNANDPAVNVLFSELTKACRARIVLIEKNNTTEDTRAYDYAYKLMALFADAPENMTLYAISKAADKLIREAPKGQPYHETLLVQLRLPDARTITDIAGWRNLIRKHDLKAFPAFAMAAKIEAENHNQPPQDLKTAEELRARCSYTRSKEDDEFATLCQRYKVNEDTFNQCLDYMRSGWPKKTTDHIPDVAIQHGKYIWERLKPTDKKALILGEITDCCQSIGGDSAQCVRDACGLPDNGIYILKDKQKIIGQAYAWISTTGNLCLDSIECLQQSIQDDDLHQILQQFAQEVLNKHPTIKRVTLGCGGKTPEDLFPNQVAIAEDIRQGRFYGDAKQQYCIARRLQAALSDNPQLTSKYPSDFIECIDYLSDFLSDTTNIEQDLTALLNQKPELIHTLTPARTRRFIEYADLPINLHDLGPAIPGQEPSDAQRIWFCFNDKGDIDIQTVYNTLPHLSIEHRLMVVKDRDRNDSTALFEAANDPELLAIILAIYPETERLAAVTAMYMYGLISSTVLLNAAQQPKLLEVILGLLPKSDLLVALTTADRYGYTTLYLAAVNPESLKVIFGLLPASEHLAAVKMAARKTRGGRDLTVLYSAACNPESLKIIIALYPKTELLAEVKKMGSDLLLRAASSDAESLKIIIALYPKTECLAEVKKMGVNLLHIAAISDSKSLQIILAIYPETERLAAVKQRGFLGRTLLHLCADKPESLKVILAFYPKTEFLAALKERDDSGDTVLHDAASNPESLKIILAIYPETERLAAVKQSGCSGDTVLHRAVSNPESLKVILALYPETERFAAVKQRNGFGGAVLLHCAYSNSESLKVILEFLPEEQILEGYNICMTRCSTSLRTEIAMAFVNAITAKYSLKSDYENCIKEDPIEFMQILSGLFAYCQNASTADDNQSIAAAKWLKDVLSGKFFSEDDYRKYEAVLNTNDLGRLFKSETTQKFFTKIYPQAAKPQPQQHMQDELNKMKGSNENNSTAPKSKG